ncbi:NAD(P)-binding protein, partial [Escherichia coli]|uniref:NAD(P)-binding protein n=1 Tax=Escherichia coli TaxID=562 RepID=UPI0034D7A6A1
MLVGSGPLHIIEAAYLGRQGKSVLILERGCALFGAWKTISHPLFGQVEMGCHIMERYQGV